MLIQFSMPGRLISMIWLAWADRIDSNCRRTSLVALALLSLLEQADVQFSIDTDHRIEHHADQFVVVVRPLGFRVI